jgi:predicted transcriptional regulator
VALLATISVAAQPKPPDQFQPLSIRDLDNHPVQTPCVGEGKRVTMIIYADPDRYKQNEYFVDRIKKYKFPLDEFCGYGVVNLKDTVLPNFMLRFILRTIRNRSEQERKAIILMDPDRILAKAWNLGDCNNQVAVILLDKNGKLLFWKAGELTEAETTQFIGLITSRVSHYSLHPER